MERTIAITCLLVLILGAACLAGSNWNSKGAIHILPHGERTCTENFPVIAGCDDIITTQPGGDLDVFPVFFDIYDYREFTFALFWPEENMDCVFTGCSDYTSATVLYSGEEVTQAWYECQPGPVAVTGWLQYDGVDGMLGFIGPAYVTDCYGSIDGVCGCYWAGYGGWIGDDPCTPCDPSAADEDTWGEIKAMFR